MSSINSFARLVAIKRPDDNGYNSETGINARMLDLHRFRKSSDCENRIDGSVLMKMCVGAVAITAFVATGAIRVMVAMHGNDAKIDPTIAAVTLLSSVTIGALLGAMLALKDCVQRKIARGERVSSVLRLLFGCGFKSVAVWIFFVFFGSSVVLPILLAISPF